MTVRTIVKTPLLVALLVGAAAVSVAAQDPPVTEQPMASRSGIDLAAMDRTGNACVDFYQFACGGWMAKHPVPADKGRFSRFDELQDRNDEILRDILEAAAKSPTAATQQIGDYYASCLDEAAIESKGLAPLKAELDAIAGMKTAADLPRVLADLHEIGTGGLFGFGSVPDFKDASQVIGGFGQGGMGLPDRDYYLKTDEASVRLRDEYVQHVARML